MIVEYKEKVKENATLLVEIRRDEDRPNPMGSI